MADSLSSFAVSVELKCTCDRCASKFSSTASSLFSDERDFMKSDSGETKEHIFVAISNSVKITSNSQPNIDRNIANSSRPVAHTKARLGLMVPSSFITCELKRCVDYLDLGNSFSDASPKSSKYTCTNAFKIGFFQKDVTTECCSISHKIHPALSKIPIEGVILSINSTNPDQEIPCFALVIFHETDSLLDVIDQIDGEAIASCPYAVIKALPLTDLNFCGNDEELMQQQNHFSTEIPSCPVCLHRIEPTKIGLRALKDYHQCSHVCGLLPSSTTLSYECSLKSASFCRNRDFVSQWPLPSYCHPCHVITTHNCLGSTLNTEDDERNILSCFHHAKKGRGQSPTMLVPSLPDPALCCYHCGMKETLWVCLTCGVVGCGRYSHAHADKHYRETGHSFSLELVTSRIWGYAVDAFVHRTDLLNCPVASLNVGNLSRNAIDVGVQNYSSAASIPPKKTDASLFSKPNPLHGYHDSSCSRLPHSSEIQNTSFPPGVATPKKALLIGEEYEALLQSALEDQAQYYEGEMTRLITELTTEEINQGKITEEEKREIHELQAFNEDLRKEAEYLSMKLIETKAQGDVYKEKYQRLRREQDSSKELLNKLRDEASTESEIGRRKVEDLEQQIDDLTANLRMMHQIAQDHELSNAQIFGTMSKEPKRKKKHRRRSRK